MGRFSPPVGKYVVEGGDPAIQTWAENGAMERLAASERISKQNYSGCLLEENIKDSKQV